MFQLYTELHRSILDVFNEHNVQIMTASYIFDPAEPKVVPRDQWLAAPAQLPPVWKPAPNKLVAASVNKVPQFFSLLE
jgi:hypothetical protein